MDMEMKKMSSVELYQGDCLTIIKEIENNSVDLILSDIPYGISYEEWDVIHDNKNSALGGSTEAQRRAGDIFKRRGKPLNGWSEEDRLISKQYQDWCSLWSSDWLRTLKPGGSCFIFAGRRYAHRCIISMEDAGFTFKDMLAWNKVTSPFRAQRVSKVFERRKDEENSKKYESWRLGNLAPVFEPILWFQKPYKIGTTITDNLLEYQLGCFNDQILHENLIEVNSKIPSGQKFHPTQKPVSILENLIKLTTFENQFVFDPFMGSGSTGIACLNTNRNFIGIELDKDYFTIAENRIKQANEDGSAVIRSVRYGFGEDDE